MDICFSTGGIFKSRRVHAFPFKDRAYQNRSHNMCTRLMYPLLSDLDNPRQLKSRCSELKTNVCFGVKAACILSCVE